jgi:type IV secretory pathway VirJ component
MKHCFFLFLLIVTSLAPLSSAAGDNLRFGRFGDVALYSRSPQPSRVVLFVSGDGGWNLGVIDMARALAELDALVVGIDINVYLRSLSNTAGNCSYSAADFEALSKYIQKTLQLPSYIPPVLVGYSSGATLVYAVLVQAPPNTFAGAISLGFCPDLDLSKPLCRGNGLEWKKDPQKSTHILFLPAKQLPSPWIALQGEVDEVCNAADTVAFVKEVNGGRVVILPKVGHGFSVQHNWLPQFRSVFTEIVAKARDRKPQPPLLNDLPLIEVPAKARDSDAMAVFLTGDGGWAGLDRNVSGDLAAAGIPVVGLNTLKYFWTPRTPKGAAEDLNRILHYYLEHWHKKKVVLAGYSLGADVLPFMATHLPRELLDRTVLIALLGPSKETAFEFHLSDWIGGTSKGLYPVLPEVEHLNGKNLLCLYGERETDSLCPLIHQPGARAVALKGSHHFGGNFTAIAEHILKALEK